MKTLSATLATLLFLATASYGQTQIQLTPGDVDVKGLEFDSQPTPLFEAGGVKTKNVPNQREWLELEAEFEVKGRDDVIIPELTFRYYIGFRDQTGQGRTLTGDVKHVNVIAGKEYYSAVYVSPDTLGKLTGDFERFQNSAVQAVGVEVYYNGVIVGLKSSMSGSNMRFWQSTGTEGGVLSKNETPFQLLWIDRYADSAAKP